MFGRFCRIIHHATIFEIEGEIYRKKTELKKITHFFKLKPVRIVDAEHDNSDPRLSLY